MSSKFKLVSYVESIFTGMILFPAALSNVVCVCRFHYRITGIFCLRKCYHIFYSIAMFSCANAWLFAYDNVALAWYIRKYIYIYNIIYVYVILICNHVA